MRVVKWEDIIHALELNLETNEAAGVVLDLLDYQFNIVQCRECKHGSDNKVYGCSLIDFNTDDYHRMYADDYCSYGERRK